MIAIVAALTLGPGPLIAAEDGESSSGDTSDSEQTGSRESSEEPTFEDEEALFDVAEDGEGDEEGEGDERRERQRRDGKPLRDMDREEARKAGFDFGGPEQPTARTTGALLAATGGLLVRGIGHWYVDDTRTALTLAALEGTSLALMGSGLVTWVTTSETVAGSAFGKTAFHMGAGLFGISYLIDVLGALQGGRLRLPSNTGRSDGLSVHAGYQYRATPVYPLRHFFVGRVDYNVGRFFGTVRTEQQFQLDYSEYVGELGVRIIRGKRQMTFGYVELLGDASSYRGDGRFDRLRGEVRLGASLDFGLVAPHLDQLAVGAEIGGGLTGHRIATPDTDSLQSPVTAPYIPAEVYTDMNLSERFNVRLSYEKRAGGPLQGTRALAGVGGLRFRYDSSQLFDLELAGRLGAGYSIHAGLSVQVWE
ncbi:MAG: hypothetical protein ABEN55_10345 [Bradymonadaceae bacterium]